MLYRYKCLTRLELTDTTTTTTGSGATITSTVRRVGRSKMRTMLRSQASRKMKLQVE